MYLFILIAVLILNKKCEGAIFKDDSIKKCCGYGEYLNVTNWSTFNCAEDTKKRLGIYTNYSNFLIDHNTGNCLDVTPDGFFSFEFRNGEISRETPIDNEAFPKCCPLGYTYSTKIHACQENITITETYINGSLVKVGLPQCKLIVDENISKVSPDLDPDDNNYCIDQDQNGHLIQRNCKKELKGVCDKIRCVKKCCPDGKSYVNGPNCVDTHVHGLDLGFSDNIADPLGIFRVFWVYGMAPRKKKLSREEILQRKREAERKRYECMKNDPQKREALKEKERLKYLKKKEKGTRKLVDNMTPREHREAKKKWREHCSNYRNKKKQLKNIATAFMRENTPETDVSDSLRMPTPGRDVADKIQKRKNRNKALRYRINKKKDDEINKLKKKLFKYKKRLTRLTERTKPKPKDTPNTKLQKMTDNPETRREVVKKALFGEVLKEQLRENLSNLNTVREKRMLAKVVSGSMVDKYKLWRMDNNAVITLRRIKKSKVTGRLAGKTKVSDEVVKAVANFFEDDSNSRLGAGKKEFITRKGTRKQKRYMLDSLVGLYSKYQKQKSQFKLSYQTFCRLRPFWIVKPKVDQRDTCLCITHANIDLKLTALHNGKILNYNSYQKLLQELCCDRYNEQCISRECQKCLNKTPSYKEFNDKKSIIYKKWIAEKAEFIDPKSKNTRRVTKHIKKSLDVNHRYLITELHEDLETLFRHERNILHQFNSIKQLKNSLTEEDVLIHVDFSENYVTKYAQEVQAFHFGGSRTQISLHTVVVYLKDKIKSYCTISTNVSHSPAAIWAHLMPIFDDLPPEIKTLHFLSDGPVTQYRNKTMFYIMANKIPERFPHVQKFTWNYTESGHGKGAPDGVGAACKRTADAVVAAGGDVENLEKFVDAIKPRCPAINLSIIQDDTIQEMSAKIEQEGSKIKNFVGTLKVHQVTGKFYNSSGIKLNSIEIVMRHLSCFCENDSCLHFKIGKILYEDMQKLRVEDVFTDSETENDAGPSCITTGNAFNTGDYILVKLPAKNMEYRYVSVIDIIDEEEDELRVTFLKLCDKKGQTFRIDQMDVADVAMNQVIEKLPNPNLLMKDFW